LLQLRTSKRRCARQSSKPVAVVPRNDRSGALPPRPAGGQTRRQPAPSFASCDRRPHGRSGRRLGKPRSPSSASGDPCRSRSSPILERSPAPQIDRRGAPLHAESIGPRTRALAARFKKRRRVRPERLDIRSKPRSREARCRRRLCWPLRTATRTHFASARPRLASTAPRPRLEARRRCSRERARPPRCVERIPCHPLFQRPAPVTSLGYRQRISAAR
jgi:hypothetical protein